MLIAAPSAARADVLWPALILEQHLLSAPAIAIGMVVELLALKLLFPLSWSRAAAYALAVNAISSLLGIVLIPFAGLLWEFGPGQIANSVTGAGTFNAITWGATYVFAVAVSTILEGLFLGWLFKLRFDRRSWGVWTAANALSVGVAAYLLATAPLEMP